MKIRNATSKLIALTVAAMAIIGSTWAGRWASATGRTEAQNNLREFHLACVGYVPGKTPRFSVLNPSWPEQRRETVRAPGSTSCLPTALSDFPQTTFTLRLSSLITKQA